MFRVILNNYPVWRASVNLPSLRSIAVLVRHTNKPRQARAVKMPWGDWGGSNSFYFSHDFVTETFARFCSFTRFYGFTPFHSFAAHHHVWQNCHAMQAMIFLKKLKRGIRVSFLFPIFLRRSKKTIQVAGKNKVSWNKFIQSKCKHYRGICFTDEGVVMLSIFRAKWTVHNINRYLSTTPSLTSMINLDTIFYLLLCTCRC